MSGDWIKIENVTPEKPEVYQIAELTGISPEHAFGCLVSIWIWADQQTVDGNAGSVTRSLLDRKSSVTGFTDAMLQVGWLIESESGFSFSNFDRHNGDTAKTRALTNKRVKRKRNADAVIKALPEKRREEKSNKKESKPKKKFPPTVEEVTAYCQKRKNGIDPQKFLDHYTASGWMRNKTKIKDWMACVRTWEGNDQNGKPERKPEVHTLDQKPTLRKGLK